MSLSSAQDLALDIAERIEGLGPIAVTRFFGGAGLRAKGVQFAFVIEGVLYLRVDERTRAEIEALGSRPFEYEGAKGTVTVGRYFEAPESVLDDDRELSRWAMEAVRAALAAKAKPARRRTEPGSGASARRGSRKASRRGKRNI